MKHNLNQIVTPIVPALETLRREIDSIDDAILDLLEQRYAVTQRVSRAKAGQSADTLPIRPGREREILERLSARAVQLPPDDIAQVWRSILSLSARSQRAYRVMLWSPEGTRVALAGLAATRYGSAVPILWAASADEAIAAAKAGNTIALIPADLLRPSQVPELALIGQYPLDCLHHPWAVAMGRLADEAGAPASTRGTASLVRGKWSLDSWKQRVHHQIPAYRDPRAVAAVEARLACATPVVEAQTVAMLTAELVEAQQGRRLLIQAGDCAEPIDATRSDVIDMSALIHKMADRLEQRDRSVIRMGRLAGQFAKPRSTSAENADGGSIAVYRGDAVNRPGASAAQRMADPERLYEAYAQSCRVKDWLSENTRACGGLGRRLFTSHEALLLNYETALTRRGGEDGQWRALSAHSLWLGDRTRDARGAHAEYLRGIANPVGIKCGPGMEPAQLVALLDWIDPQRTSGRIMLIARLGHDRISAHLGKLMEAVRGAGHPALWLCDPMHGNTRTVDGVKTRLVADIVSEVRQFATIARATGIHAGGLHLEVTPTPVLECVDDIAQASSPRRYDSRCDPRLNANQAMQVVQSFADAIECGR